MTIAFISFFLAIVNEKFQLKRLLPILFLSLIIGITSIAYWYLGELNGQGDLRPYVFIQFFPIVGIMAIAVIYPETSNKSLIWILSWYALAKFLELTDDEIFHIGNIISGHSLKHIAASIAVLCILLMIKNKTKLILQNK